MSFRSRTLVTPDNVGERLRQLREESKLTLDAVASQLNISIKHLQAIEESRYQDLPGKVYARNFVRRYIELVGLNVETAMEKFDQEYAVLTAPQQRRQSILPQRAQAEQPWWLRHSRLLFAGAVVAIVAGYFGWQIVRLVTPPQLTVTQPETDVLVRTSMLTITGSTEPSAEVRINNETAEVSATGEFSVPVDLQVGLNTIKITAKKKRSGEQVVIRQVLYEAPK